MRLLLLFVSIALIGKIGCPPVKEAPKTKVDSEAESFGLAYEHYLKEVVSTLEEDEEFKKKLESANATDIQNGDIANNLQFVNHKVRTKLDELKRMEIQRLSDLLRAKDNVDRGVPVHQLMNELAGHIDRDNPHSFEIDDLSKLIKQATGDLEDIDSKRKTEYKTYEMDKKLKEAKKLSHLNEPERDIAVKRLSEQQKKHNDHPKLNHPGSKDQLEELWEGEGYEKENFNPRTFFLMHDSNGDGYLDESEVEGLFQRELDKLYNADAPEDDQRQRYEEMERMREHVMNEIDKNSDKMISLSEFIESTKNANFDNNQGWEDLEDKEEFTDDEFDNFQKDYLKENHLNNKFEPLDDYESTEHQETTTNEAIR